MSAPAAGGLAEAGGGLAQRSLPVLNPVCFVAGTLIHTRDGRKKIEDIKAGDQVLSYNEQTGRAEYQPVAQTFVRQAKAVLEVHIAGESEALGVTPEHPFYVRVHGARSDTSGAGDDDPDSDKGEWTAAQDLRPGDEVRRPDGTWAQVMSVERRAGGATVYNFEVAQNHNYFVGKAGTLVHNTCALVKRLYQESKFAGNQVRGFANTGEVLERLGNLRNSLIKVGIVDIQVGIRGSSVTNTSSKFGGAFRWQGDKLSDIDFFASSASLERKFASYFKKGRIKPDALAEIAPELQALFDGFGSQTTEQLGRKADVNLLHTTLLNDLAPTEFILYRK